MDLGLKGKVAIVTGTNRKGAMGEAIAKTIAAEGANIACVDIMVEGAEEIDSEDEGNQSPRHGRPPDRLLSVTRYEQDDRYE